MSANCCRMTRCECHEVPFSEVLDFSERTGIEDFDRLCALVGCGQTCTACHCDLQEYLEENLAATEVAAKGGDAWELSPGSPTRRSPRLK